MSSANKKRATYYVYALMAMFILVIPGIALTIINKMYTGPLIVLIGCAMTVIFIGKSLAVRDNESEDE